VTPSPSSPAHYVRRGLLRIDDNTVLAAVDTLDLRGNAKISAVVGMPLRSLQQRRDVTAFAIGAPIAAVKGLVELLAMEPLEKVIAALGDHADAPNYEQLAGAVDQLIAEGVTDDDIVALLTFAIGEEFPAAPHCRQLLEERPQFALPELPEIAPSSALLAPKVVDPEVREQRKARREEEKRRRRNSAPVHPARPVRVKSDKKAAPPELAPAPVEPAATVERRRLLLTPGESERFSVEHPFVATVVLAEIAFDAVDPDIPEQRAKLRPALVVAAGESGVLVRGIYSNVSTTRTLFQPWRRLGFDHISYIDDARTALALSSLDELERLGRLSDEEWNSVSQ
jgi:hypothetical protein